MKSLRRIRIDAGMTGAELAEKLKPMFPRVNKAVISFAEDPNNTGVTLTPSMRQEIETQTGLKFGSQDKNRKDGYHLSFWIDEAAYSEFNSLKSDFGLTTGKDTFIRLIKNAARPIAADER